MAAPSEKLAESLSALKELQDTGIVAIRTSHLSRTNRQRLLNAGFIREVMKGWYTPTRPDEPDGESTGWYASYWAFCADYFNDRFGEDWCLSPEQSLSLHIGEWTVPKQLLVRSPRGGNKPTGLLFGTSLFDVRLELPPAADREVKNGMRIFSLPAALISCAPGQFIHYPDHVRAALAMVAEPSDILRRLLGSGRTVVAGRLAGGFRNIGRGEIADQILRAMRAAGPPNHEAVRELMPELFELLETESEPSVRVVLGHFVFVYIHPYMDGNGRMGRFLMNSMMAAGDYSWTIIPVERRAEYMSALEAASVSQNIKPFAEFLADLVTTPSRS